MPIVFRSILTAAVLLAGCARAPQPTAAPTSPSPVPAALDTALSSSVAAQRVAPRDLPVPAPVRDATARGTRSTTGAPGREYRQQRVRYSIEAELDPRTAMLRGSERIVYHNQSTDTLRSIVLNLYQNIFSEGVPRNRYAAITGGLTLERVAAQGRGLESIPDRIPVVAEPPADSPVGYAVQGTLGRLVLPRPLVPGDSATLEIDWRFKVPPAGTFRTAWQDALGGRAFQVAQWYPQIAVYDDLRGWDATPYLGDGEFYLEYGDFDVALTVPTGYLIGATGVLRNPVEVLTPEAQRRLDAALRSDSVAAIVTEADLAADNATQPSPDGQLTWRFRATDVRDFAFATSDRYVWDATRAVVKAGDGEERSVAIHALYRPGAANWERAARYGQHAIGFFSRELIPYIYPQLTITEGSVGGMEYPQLVFIGGSRTPESLQGVIAHEVGHEWFPMMIGSDEAAYAWMDEGVTTFYEALARNDFFPGADAFADDRASYLAAAGTEREVPLMRHTDLVSPYGARGVAAYTKPGTLLRSLRAILGEETFDRAMRSYAREWLFKHPSPWDFFNTVERVSGRELDWFFHPWWFQTGTLDQAIGEVEVSGDSVRITVADQGDIPAPTLVVVTMASGQTATATIPVEQWLSGSGTAAITLPAAGPIVQVELDPEQLFPDVDRKDNLWTAPRY